MVLDEPTNDLDIETLDLLQELLGEYPGTILLVSHDRDFLDRVATSVIVSEGDGRWREYAGGYSDMVAQRGYGLSGPSAPEAPKPEKARRARRRGRRQSANCRSTRSARWRRCRPAWRPCAPRSRSSNAAWRRRSACPRPGGLRARDQRLFAEARRTRTRRGRMARTRDFARGDRGVAGGSCVFNVVIASASEAIQRRQAGRWIASSLRSSQ